MPLPPPLTYDTFIIDIRQHNRVHEEPLVQHVEQMNSRLTYHHPRGPTMQQYHVQHSHHRTRVLSEKRESVKNSTGRINIHVKREEHGVGTPGGNLHPYPLMRHLHFQGH